MNKIFLIIIFVLLLPLNANATDWRVMPIRSELEYGLGKKGGEGMQWHHGSTRCEANPNYIYWAHDDDGIWRSSNGGDSWTPCKSKGMFVQSGLSVEVDPVDPQLVLAMGGGGLWYHDNDEFTGIYRSTDAGQNWDFVKYAAANRTWDTNQRRFQHAIAFDRSSISGGRAQTWYAGFHKNGLFKSTDAGATWGDMIANFNDAANEVFTTVFSMQVASDGSAVYIGSEDGLYKYTAGGGLAALGDLPAGNLSSIACHPTDENIIWVVVEDDGLYKSTNGGTNFSEIVNGYVVHIFMNYGYPDKMYLVYTASSNGVYYTSNGGDNWTKYTSVSGYPGSVYNNQIYERHTGILPNCQDSSKAVALSEYKAYKTEDGGVTWNLSNELFTGYAVGLGTGICFDKYDVDKMTLFLNDVVVARTNNGFDWWYRLTTQTDGNHVLDWLPNEISGTTFNCWVGAVSSEEGSETMVAVAGSSAQNGTVRIIRSASDSAGWEIVDTDMAQDMWMKWHSTDPNIVYASTRISRDAGETWTDVDFGAYTTGEPRIWGMCDAYPNVIWGMYLYRQGLLRSTDAGVTWARSDSRAIMGWTVRATFCADPCDPNVCYSIDADGGGDISRYVHDDDPNDSDDWTTLGLIAQVDVPLQLEGYGDDYYYYVSNIAIDPRHTNIIYANISGMGIPTIWRSTDTGTTWTDITGNLRHASWYLAVHPLTGDLFANNLTGTWVYPPPYADDNSIYEKAAATPTLPTSSPPVLDAIGDKSVDEGQELSLTISATDPNGDTITYSATGTAIDANATFSSQTFIWTPSYSQAGTYPVTFIASDGQAQDSETITITVNNVNRPPVFWIIGDKSVNENSTLSFSVSATDPDGDTISYSLEGLPTGAVFGSQTFTWTPGYDQAGTYSVTFIASDGEDQDSEPITITVINVNRPPVLSSIGNKSVYAGDLLTFTLNATDPDGETITYSVDSLPSGAAFASQTFNWTPDGSQTGSYDVTFTASDGQGGQDYEKITITVTADTSAPTVTNLSPQADSIQTPLNTLVILGITDAGDGIDADTVTIKVNDNEIYKGNTDKYSSAYGECYRIGTNANYRFIYQSEQNFDFDQLINVTVNATDLAGNSMSEYSYSFTTEMRSFGDNKKVNSDTLSSNGRPVTVRDSGGNIWTAWHTGTTGSRDICIGKLTVEAESFSNITKIRDNTTDQCNPAIAVDSDDKLYVAWQDNRNGNWDIYVSTSSDGINWSTEQTAAADPNDNQINPAIVIDSSNNAYVVWEDDRNDNQDIYIATSNNSFVSKTVSQITSDTSDQSEPAIAADSDNTIYVVWTDTRNSKNDIYGATSNNGPWTNVAIVNNANNQSSPAIATEAVGSILHLVWVDDRDGENDIYYAQTTDGLPGSPLTGSSIIDDTTDADQKQPVIAVTGSTGSNLHVFACWKDERDADDDLYLAEISSGSGTNVFVGDNSTNSDQTEPAIGLDGDGQPYLVWTDSRNTNTDIYYAGSTFIEPDTLASADVSISAGATIGTNPAISIDDVSVVVPAGAYPCDITISISKINNPLAFTMQCLGAYDFGPSNIEFTQPVTVTIPYSFTGTEDVALAYWYNSLTDELSQQGITNVTTITVSSTVHALRFNTTHFTPFYVFLGSVAASSIAGGGGGGCSMSPDCQASAAELLLPYIGLTAAMVVLKLRDRRKRKARNITKSGC
ncbi:hypothetical protein ES707_04121 [subsurface metagenome]